MSVDIIYRTSDVSEV